MSLTEEIGKFQESMKGQIPDDVMATMMESTKRLIESGIAEKALKVGDKAPDFTLPNATGEDISLATLLSEGAVVINFYRGAWCPYCNLELAAFQKALPEIESLGAKLIAISPNLPDKSLTTIEKHDLKFEVLTDKGNSVADKFGLVFTLDEEIPPIYKSLGVDIPEHNGDESWRLPIPATFVIDTDGTIIASFVNADYTTRMEPSAVIEALKNRSN